MSMLMDDEIKRWTARHIGIPEYLHITRMPAHGGLGMARAIRINESSRDGRGGVGRRLSRTQVEQIRRTVTRASEVMVKVSSGSGASICRGVCAHFNYISRQGDLEIETDDGERSIGDEAGRRLIREWNLDLDEDRQRPDLFAINRRPSKAPSDCR